MEVAPGVVDVIAVALSSATNVITCVVKSDVPADESDLHALTWVDVMTSYGQRIFGDDCRKNHSR